MPTFPLRRCAIAGALTFVALAAPTTASAAPLAPNALAADVKIERFTTNGSGITALGTQSTKLAGAAAKQRVRFAVAGGSTCNVLTLNLDQLHVQLLGVDLVTSAINLRITGRKSATLGALFCRLARQLKIAKASSARAAAASLNRYLRHQPMHVLRLRADLPTVTADAAQAPAAAPGCKVLDVVLGPLDLDLLGLVVNLYGPDRNTPVEVHVTANPAGGVLGTVFCKLANGQGV